jgi:O-succinylbenzoic acid--CoA ligase
VGTLDREGRLRVTGRLTDRIMTGGVTVDAHEVADVLRSHPDVVDAHVFGRPDPTWGEAVVALVAVGERHEPSAEALREWLRPRLSGPKRPKVIAVVDRLPRNPNGKIDRSDARALLDAHT